MKLIRLPYALLLVALLLAWGANTRPVAAAPLKQATATTWTVLVGAEGEITQGEHGPVGAWQLMRFYPDKLTINEGDTIVFKLNSAELHNVMLLGQGQSLPASIIPEGGDSHRLLANTIAFLPQGGSSYDGSATVGSGQLTRDPQGVSEYKLTFPKAGSYQFLCSIHSALDPVSKEIRGMVGALTVQAAGSAYPQSQQQIDTAAQAAIQADAAEAAQSDDAAQQVTSRQGPNGNTIYTMNMGYTAMNGMADWMRFSQPDLQIHEGDSVEWVQKTMAPHTITFVSGGKEPDFIQPQAQPAGPPKLVINPQVVLPAGDSVYKGEGYFNSGLIPGTMDPAPGPRTYQLTFASSGHYEYICVIHDQEGMSGYITVSAATDPIQPALPRTGSGSDLIWWTLIVAAIVLMLGVLLRGRVAQTRDHRWGE